MKMKYRALIVTFLLIATSCHVSKESRVPQTSNKGSVFRLSKEEKKEGYKILFDGGSMSQWTSNTDEYVLENGCIVMYPKNGHGNLYTKQEFDNFILRFEFLLTPEANNGLGIRHKMITAQSGYDGMELQILDNEAPIYQDLKPYQYHGSVYGWIPAKRGFLKPAGEWNYQEVVADGNHIKVILNGTVIVDGDLREATKETPADKIPATLFYEKGHIAFLGHNSVVSFRNIRIKELKN
ncbi:MAG: DUF1080 domain-containing protein [Proteiniphilum sp.]